MLENNRNIFEMPPELMPTVEHIYAVLKALIDKEPKEVRRREDDKGLYLLEIVFPGESKNEVIEYLYMRQGRYKECQSATTEIHVVHYQDNFPISGTSVARYINEKWYIFK